MDLQELIAQQRGMLDKLLGAAPKGLEALFEQARSQEECLAMHRDTLDSSSITILGERDPGMCQDCELLIQEERGRFQA